MKISYISGAYVPSIEANSMHVMRMCQAFADLGHEVTLHVRRGDKVSDDHHHYGVRANFRIVKYHRPQIRVYGALNNAARVALGVRLDSKPDLLYAREIYGLTFVNRFVRRTVPFIWETHWKPKHFVQRGLEARLLRQKNCLRVVVISDALKQIYKREFPWFPEDKIRVLHDGADPIVEAGEGIEERQVGRLQVAYVGGILPGRGIEVILALAKKNDDLDFQVLGGSSAQLQCWRERAQDIPNLRFHGFVPPNELSKRYRDFDVVLAPYQKGTASIGWASPMKLFEYMAHGKAIICSDFPVMREILENGRDGLLVAPNRIEDWNDALHKFRDAKLRRKLSQAAQAKLERDFSWKKRAGEALSGLTLRQVG